MSRLWSPVDLVSGQPSVSPRTGEPNSSKSTCHHLDTSLCQLSSARDRDPSKHRKSLVADDDPIRKLMIPGGSRSSSDFPPAAHSGNHTSISSSGRHHVITDTRNFGKRSAPDQQGILKKPRVRDYLGHRGSTGRSQGPDLSQYLNPARFSQPQFGLPPIPSVKPKDLICDTVAESSNDEVNAPLDLCIKKSDAKPSKGPDSCDSRRSSADSGDGPKKRGRKPKSLLAATATSSTNNTTVTNSHLALPLVGPASEVRPKKRGRPPLLSPPPNIGLPNPVEEGLALMNRLFGQTLGQPTQLQPGWPTFSPSGQIIFPRSSKINGSGSEDIGDRLLPSKSQTLLSRQRKPSESDSDEDQEDPSRADLRPGLNDEDIRQPLQVGWKRHTIVKKIGSFGVHGEVLYFSPEGKRLRSHNDVSRYFAKYSVKNLRKEYFSFSNKWLVGEFIEPTLDRKDHRIVSESEIIKRIEEMRRLKRKKMASKPTARRGRPPRESSDGNEMVPEQRLNQDLMNLAATARMNELKVLQMLQQAFAQTQNLEAERQRQEEEAQRKAKEAKEREMKRQQMELQKEQELQRRKELQMMAEIEKERRRQHMMLVRSLELFKRQEDRDRKREEMLAERKLVQEKKMQKKRIEMELMKELRKPVDDMMLKDLKPLPVLNRIPGLKLPSAVFAELLMMFEFLNNFGETLGFDMDSLPTMNTLQLAILNLDEGAEEELLSVLHHLLVCAIEDPGPATNMTTITGQKLKDAPVTNINVSEILKIYLQSFIHHRDSARDGIEGKLVTVLTEGKPFLSLSAHLKAQTLSFLCNELLCNQSIVKQIEENIESIANLRREKWLVDCDLRKFRGIKMKREMREKMEQSDKEGGNSEEVKNGVAENEEGKNSVLKAVDEDSDDSGDEPTVHPVNIPFIPPPIGALSSYTAPYSNAFDEEPGMSNEEIDKKLDKLNRQATIFTNKLNRAIHGLRVAPLGQDRYRRRYWLLPATGGVFVEGLESGEPEAAEENRWATDEEEEEEIFETKPDVKEKVEEDKPLENGNDDEKLEDEETAVASHDVNGETEGTEEKTENMVNGSPEKITNGITPVPFPLVGIESQLPIKSNKPWFSLLPRVPCCETIVDPLKPITNGEEEQESEMDVTEKESKSTSLPLFDLSTLTSSIEDLGEVCPALQRQLAKQNEEQYDIPKKIPGKYQLGWWRITDPSQLRALNEALHERGVRERNLSKHIIKHLSGIAQKCKCDAAELEISDMDRLICEGCPFGAPQPSESDFDPEVALRVDTNVLQQIEDLEEKIASSSMQVRGWKQSGRITSDPSTTLVYKSAEELKELDDMELDEDHEAPLDNNPVTLGRERLLTTEAAIERRYLKPPLGFKSNTILIPTGAADELAENAADENATSGLLRWREAVRECVCGSQLALLLHFLESCIAWDKSIMRASCQFCSGGENEEQLLLCDGCDKGYHMYCFKPRMEAIPEGDWFCFECQNKNTIDKICVVCGRKGKLLSCDTCPKVYHPNCVDPPVSKPPKGKWSCHMCKKTPKKVTGRKTATSAAAAASAVAEDKSTKESPLKESFPGSSNTSTNKESGASKKASTKKPPKAEKVADDLSKKVRRSKENKESAALSACQVILAEMEKHSDSWPFQKPVNTKQFPTYKKIIKQPMDLASMKGKFETGTYKSKGDFHTDVLLMFSNCEIFNEDESPVGQAGHTLKAFFDKRWDELVVEKK